VASSLEQLSEDELVVRARAAMGRAVAAGRGTLGWSVQWAAYDTVMAELDRRALRWAAHATPRGLAELRVLLAAAGLDRDPQ
jgi:hypothetical protein